MIQKHEYESRHSQNGCSRHEQGPLKTRYLTVLIQCLDALTVVAGQPSESSPPHAIHWHAVADFKDTVQLLTERTSQATNADVDLLAAAIRFLGSYYRWQSKTPAYDPQRHAEDIEASCQLVLGLVQDQELVPLGEFTAGGLPYRFYCHPSVLQGKPFPTTEELLSLSKCNMALSVLLFSQHVGRLNK